MIICLKLHHLKKNSGGGSPDPTTVTSLTHFTIAKNKHVKCVLWLENIGDIFMKRVIVLKTVSIAELDFDHTN